MKAILAEPGARVDLPESVLTAIEIRDRLKAQVKEAEADLDVVENEIRAALGEATEGFAGGELVVSWRSAEQTRADPDAMRAAGVFDEFSKTIPVRTLRRHKPKGAS